MSFTLLIQLKYASFKNRSLSSSVILRETSGQFCALFVRESRLPMSPSIMQLTALLFGCVS
jgi:hypothetical protein